MARPGFSPGGGNGKGGDQIPCCRRQFARARHPIRFPRASPRTPQKPLQPLKSRNSPLFWRSRVRDVDIFHSGSHRIQTLEEAEKPYRRSQSPPRLDHTRVGGGLGVGNQLGIGLAGHGRSAAGMIAGGFSPSSSALVSASGEITDARERRRDRRQM